MWPGLIPGDVLRTALTPACMLRPGMICVLHPEAGEPFIHRIIRIRNFPMAIGVTTAGDNSGIDDTVSLLSRNEQVPVVNGVLRKGNYRPPARLNLLPVFRNTFTIRLWNRVVRMHLW